MPRNFDAQTFLDTDGAGRCVRKFNAGDVVVSQDTPADRMFFIQRGNVRLTVSSQRGRAAVIETPGAGEFFGEGCLAGQRFFTATATATSDATILEIDKLTMTETLLLEPDLRHLFVIFLLARHLKLQDRLSANPAR